MGQGEWADVGGRDDVGETHFHRLLLNNTKNSLILLNSQSISFIVEYLILQYNHLTQMMWVEKSISVERYGWKAMWMGGPMRVGCENDEIERQEVHRSEHQYKHVCLQIIRDWLLQIQCPNS